jgi:predicted AAA+ superfamily ATPase
MERLIFKQLNEWKLSDNRKPLIIRGARQVGKTWAIKEFGYRNYKNVAYINFESSKSLHNLFDADYNIDRILFAFKVETGINIDHKDTLIILDEIQECRGALTSLKYFYENAPQYHIIAAGSLLGVAMSGNTSFPVGKVNFLNIYPMSFIEFLGAIKEQPLIELLEKEDWQLIKVFKAKYIEYLKIYFYVGGMPEAVQAYVDKKTTHQIRNIQTEILTAYEQDFSKHAPNELVPRIKLVWHSIVAQLSKENRKFIFGTLKKGARAKEFELALSWLVDAGLIYKINLANKPSIPLVSYSDSTAFKIFGVDVGLLSAMGDIDSKTLLNGNVIFEEFKGAIAEQFVLQQIKSTDNYPVCYWTNENSTAEIDFIVQKNGKIIPIEVKASENLQAKSLKVYCQKFQPDEAIRTSLSDFRCEEWLTNIPLYAIWNYFRKS